MYLRKIIELQSSWQNIAKYRINDLRVMTKRNMDKYRAPIG